MKMYKNFNEIFKAQSNIKSDIATFNSIKTVHSYAGGQSFTSWYIKDDKTGYEIFSLHEDNSEPDSSSRIPFYINIDCSILSYACGNTKEQSYYDSLTYEELKQKSKKEKKCKEYLRDYCISQITNYCATHYIDARRPRTGDFVHFGAFTGYAPQEAMGEFAQYLDDLVLECKDKFKHWNN